MPKLSSSEVHESIQALMTEALPGEKAEDVIRRKCRNMVEHARALGWSGPPFDPVVLASCNGIRVEITGNDIGGEGRLLRLRKKRLLIEVHSGALEVRQRFTICHELAHTCFPDCYEKVRLHSNHPLTASERQFERLCDIGAAELLMPVREFTADLGDLKIGCELVQRISDRYISSLDATARRATEHSRHAHCLAFLEPAVNGPTGKSLLQVQYTVTNSAFPFRIFPKTKVPLKSVANACFNDNQPKRALREYWFAAGAVRPIHIEVLRLPEVSNPGYAKVMAILTPN